MLAVGAGWYLVGGIWIVFSLTYCFSFFSPSPSETAQYRLKTVCKVKVKVSHSLIAVGALGVRFPLYLGHS